MQQATTVGDGVSAPPTVAATGSAERTNSIYVALMMGIVMMLATADRNILSVLLVPIQNDLGVSDTAMGALTGIAFTAVYATVALPMARLADRGNRRNIIALAMLFWSGMAALCGAAFSFLTLALARVGVAAGEATASPSIMSLIGDQFSPQRRGTALGFIMMGTALGVSLGAYIAGTVTEHYGWQWAFVAMGAPGIIVAILFRFTVKEPPRGAFEAGDRPEHANADWRANLKEVMAIKTAWPLLFAKMAYNWSFMGYLAWLPAYLMRVHGMSTAEMSKWYGLTIGIGAVLATVIAGTLSDRLSRHSPRWRNLLSAIMLLMGVPLVIAVVSADTLWVVILMMLLLSLFTGGVTSVATAAGLDIVRPGLRGFMSAAMTFCVMVIGGGLGPMLLGAINDVMQQSYGSQSLRYTLLFVPITNVIAAGFFIWAARTTDADVARARNGGV